jgi:hypothetical protein
VGGFTWREDAPPGRWIWAAVVAFVIVAVACVYILWPRRFPVTQNPSELVLKEETGGLSADDMTRDLAIYMGRMYDGNRSTLNRLMWVYCGAVVALLLEITALILNLWSR